MRRALFLSLFLTASATGVGLAACGDSTFTGASDGADATTNDGAINADGDTHGGDDGGGSGEGGTAIDSGPTIGTDGGPLLHVFVTSKTYDGQQVGSVDSANALCKAAAVAGGLSTRDFHAWISSETKNAVDNVKGDGPWYLRDGTTLAFASRNDLLGSPKNAIDRTQSGVVVSGSALRAWTGSTGSGTVQAGQTCVAWGTNSSSASGEVGDLGTDSTWATGTSISCNSVNALVCFEQ